MRILCHFCAGLKVLGCPDTAGTSRTQGLHLKLRDHHRRGRAKTVKPRGPSRLLFDAVFWTGLRRGSHEQPTIRLSTQDLHSLHQSTCRHEWGNHHSTQPAGEELLTVLAAEEGILHGFGSFCFICFFQEPQSLLLIPKHMHLRAVLRGIYAASEERGE